MPHATGSPSKSPPATPGPELPSDLSKWRFEIVDLYCECSEMYRPGGYHPVGYGDKFHEDTYKVIRKLGYGSVSTVWLATDIRNNRYVALKIMTAKKSINPTELEIIRYLSRQANYDNYITILLDTFIHEGPNGKHLCLVFEPMGPSTESMVPRPPEYPPKQPETIVRCSKLAAKKILSDALQGLAFLHENNIVHGDINPGNLLFSISDITNVAENNLKQDETTEDTVEKLWRLDEKIDKWGPEHLYQAMPLEDFAQLGPNARVKLCDLGSAFWANNPPSTHDSSIALRAPELILGKPFGAPIDIWALGCLLFELLAGRPIFLVNPDHCETQKNKKLTDDDHLIQLHDIIGKLPDDVMEAWPRAKKCFNPVTHQPRKKFRIHGESYDPLEVMFAKNKLDEIDDAESTVICSLIRKMLVYSPAERPSATELLRHPWFSA
ncbi:hypothetical protein Clacol_009708 [Clathrus columnatus]|uniref:non-specific serine/threonine protein kinase n=1 Tax=Clathrus columnatus TaxID=1419009 RepID=A0AAV5ARE6_9AGAM|nr:hypothetical protein Clacol_009708 [Clathrus columnatus]